MVRGWAIGVAVSLLGTISIISVSSSPADAGTGAYFATCFFNDRGNNNGGNISRMPCYVVEGGNIHGVFIHILWKDGVKTRLNSKSPDFVLKDLDTGRTYKRVGRSSLVADQDGDLITFEDTRYATALSFDDPSIQNWLKSR